MKDVEQKIVEVKIMFGKKKLYEIVWSSLVKRTTIIAARNETQALKKFYKKYDCHVPTIISFREYKLKD